MTTKKATQEKEPCPFCDQSFGKSGLNNHIIHCEKNPDRVAYVPKEPEPQPQPPQPEPMSQEEIDNKKVEVQADKERSTVERQTRRARLSAKLKKIRKNLRKVPKELEDDADELRDVIAVHIRTLKNTNITETMLDEIESVIEDDIELDYDELMADVKPDKPAIPLSPVDAQFEHWKKTGSLDGAPSGNSSEDYSLFLEQRRASMDMAKERQKLDLERTKIELENLRNQSKPKEPQVDEKKQRLLPNEQTVMMNDKDYADYLLQWERIEASKKAEKEGIVEFPVPDGRGNITKMKIPSSQVPMFQQLFYKQDDPNKDMKELMKQQADQIKHMEESSTKKMIEDLRAQMDYDPDEAFKRKMQATKEMFPQLDNPSGRDAQIIAIEAQRDFQNKTMEIIDKRLDSTDRKFDKFIDYYMEANIDVAKDKAVAKARKKAELIDAPASPTKADIDNLVRDMDEADKGRHELPQEPNAPLGGFQVLGGKGKPKKKNTEEEEEHDGQ
ncbi:MAG: hypothetical protein UY48_C0049G0011 [Candidatus Gottesmanbacteria bacterium GW2011_GWB1_49_7]|uniref:Uncharacterized protein n=1 Tax=Candidatus Gottesmanbacteria bacterium GW2011_GWB1_49_7 TaxID=1618448 RepID=A0A0G1VU61_9BACT|nr:MAG: hypothetical protein UY48_C0049G0011 [Candidatus Gottesmanbacteria bacterium GW2011_GWB1_49_7]